ncbi:MAG: tetratricopeptide repeat protein, partial [Chitinophagaceae bacterium]
MNNRSFIKQLLSFILFFTGIVSFAQPVSDEAQKYYDRGQAALEMVQTRADYDAAIAEFTKAATLAPNWPDVYYALGQVQEKIEKYAEAIASYKKCLSLAPGAANAGTVKTLINKLEYKLDKAGEKQKIIALLTKWNTPGSTVKFTKTGGGPGGVYTLRQFLKSGENLQAYIATSLKDTPLRNKLISDEQTVPVEFDGRIIKFKYDYYNCPTLPEFQYCHAEVKIIAELVSVSPIKFKVKEEWKSEKTGNINNYDAEWQFSE